jgi:hypothetical protein
MILSFTIILGMLIVDLIISAIDNYIGVKITGTSTTVVVHRLFVALGFIGLGIIIGTLVALNKFP